MPSRRIRLLLDVNESNSSLSASNLWVKFACVLLLSPITARTETATITMDGSKPGPVLNARMYGIFLEEINQGADGGLYAELVRNRGFEDSRPPEGYGWRQPVSFWNKRAHLPRR